jgi:putative phosphoribosyl transferase
MHPLFEDRIAAGKQLATKLRTRFESGRSDLVLLALAKGGVPVAFEIAKALDAPLEVLIVRKIGHPLHPDYEVGAIVEDSDPWIDSGAAGLSQVTRFKLNPIIETEKKEIARRIALYRNNLPLPYLHGKTVVLIDDGLATGSAALSAAHFLKERGASDLVLAVPVCSKGAEEVLSREVDEVIYLHRPEDFRTVAHFYVNYPSLTDKEVIDYLSDTSRVHTYPPKRNHFESMSADLG